MINLYLTSFLKIIYFYFLFKKNFIVIQLQLCALSPHPSTHPSWTPSLPHLHPPPWFGPCVPYSSSCNPLSPLSYLFIFRERGREGEREGEKHQRVVASHMPPTGDLARNPGMCPDWELNWWWPFGSQSGAQSIEPPQPGKFLKFWKQPWLVQLNVSLSPPSPLSENK